MGWGNGLGVGNAGVPVEVLMYPWDFLAISLFEMENEKWSKLGFFLQYTLIKQYTKHKHLTHSEIIGLHRRLASGSFEFGRMYRLFIPKPPGKVGLRPITIPHRLDRALLRALHLTLTAALSPCMEANSHGFLPL